MKDEEKYFKAYITDLKNKKAIPNLFFIINDMT